MARTSYYFDMDGVMANFHEHKDGWKYAGSYNFIRNLKPFMDTVNLINDMIANGKSVYISSLCRNETAKQAKIDWLAEYIPNLRKDHIIILVGNGKKVENRKTKGGVLIDDKEANIKQWRKAGLKAVYVEVKGQVDMTKIQ